MSSNQRIKKIKYALRFVPDKAYIQLYYFLRFRRFCNFKNPKTYNEKLNWLKLHDHNPDYEKMVDKSTAKNYAASIIGEQYIIPTLGVWDSFDEIEFDEMPNQFVLKCTHDSEGLIIVKDKSQLDFKKAKFKMESALKQNFFYIGREWCYKNIKPRILAEQYMEDSIDKELRDYKFFCFDGEPKALFIATDRGIDQTKFDYFDTEFNHLDFIQSYPNSETPIREPINFGKMIELSRILSRGMKHVRVDLYEINNQVYFGELTFYHYSGLVPFIPEKWDCIFGGWLDISDIIAQKG